MTFLARYHRVPWRLDVQAEAKGSISKLLGKVGFAAALLLLPSTFVLAQTSQFFFDPNGNLLVQATEFSAPPRITGQPQNRTVDTGATASFFVVASGSLPLTYQWRFNGVNIGGATNDTLLLSDVSAGNEGQYSVVVNNLSGSVTSASASLFIDTDHDGLGDSWELAHFPDLDQNAAGDFDGDGASNLREFQDGTNPTDPNSFAFRLLAVADAGTVIKVPDQPNYTNGQSVTLTAVPHPNGAFHAWLGAVVTRTNPLTLVMTNDKTVYARFTPIVFTWVNPAGGDWEEAANWMPDIGPGSNDTVVINRSVTVALNTPADCVDVTLGSAASNPALTGTGSLTVRGNLTWASGEMSGSGRTIIESGGTLNLGNPVTLLLNGRTLENGGTAFWTDLGTLSLNSGAVLTNRAGALFQVQNAASFGSFSGVNRIDNAGTFRKSIAAGTTTVPSGVSFNNHGVVEIETGALSLAGGGTHSGSFDVAAGTTLILRGTHNANGGSSITGAGNLAVSDGTANLAGLVNVTGTNTFDDAFLGGSANVTGNYICTNSTLNIAGGFTAGLSGTGLVSPAVLNLGGNGNLSGTSTVTVLSAMNWTGGGMSGGGRTIIAPGATLNLANPLNVGIGNRILDNAGTILWTGSGAIIMDIGVVLTNRAGALFHVQNPSQFFTFFSAGNRIDNAGTFRKSASSGTTTVGSGISFNNYGMVDIRSGILTMNGGYNSAAGATLNCVLGGITPGVGYGRLQVAGNVTLAGNLSVTLTNNFIPPANSVYTVLSAGTRTGTFADFIYPSDSLTMELSNSPTAVIVRVTDVLTSLPQPILLAPEVSGADLKLTWTSVSNFTYRVEFNPDLTPSNWTELPGDVIGLSNTAFKLDPLTTSNRVYRVRVLP